MNNFIINQILPPPWKSYKCKEILCSGAKTWLQSVSNIWCSRWNFWTFRSYQKWHGNKNNIEVKDEMNLFPEIWSSLSRSEINTIAKQLAKYVRENSDMFVIHDVLPGKINQYKKIK